MPTRIYSYLTWYSWSMYAPRPPRFDVVNNFVPQDVTEDLARPYLHSGANITFTRLAASSTEMRVSIALIKKMICCCHLTWIKSYPCRQLSDALLIDSLKLLTMAISPADHVDTFPAGLSCDGNDHWDKGETLMGRLTKVGQIRDHA